MVRQVSKPWKARREQYEDMSCYKQYQYIIHKINLPLCFNPKKKKTCTCDN